MTYFIHENAFMEIQRFYNTNYIERFPVGNIPIDHIPDMYRGHDLSVGYAQFPQKSEVKYC